MTVKLVDVEKIVVSPFARELYKPAVDRFREIFRTVGFDRPLPARPLGSQCEIADGRQRFEAAKKILNRIPLDIQERTDAEMAAIVVTANFRMDINPLDVQTVLEHAAQAGMKPGAIAKFLSLPMRDRRLYAAAGKMRNDSYVSSMLKDRGMLRRWRQVALAGEIDNLAVRHKFVDEIGDHLSYNVSEDRAESLRGVLMKRWVFMKPADFIAQFPVWALYQKSSRKEQERLRSLETIQYLLDRYDRPEMIDVLELASACEADKAVIARLLPALEAEERKSSKASRAA